MRLFTITASIMSLVAGITIGDVIPREQPGHAYWCGKIAGEEWVQGEILHDRDPVTLPECDWPRRLAEDYDKGHGTYAGTESVAGNFLARMRSEVGSFVHPKSLAATP